MATDSLRPSSSTQITTAEPAGSTTHELLASGLAAWLRRDGKASYLEGLSFHGAGDEELLAAPTRTPPIEEPAHARGALERGPYEVRTSLRREVLGQFSEDPFGRARPIRPPVQGEVLPRIGIPILGARGEVGRIREDAVESTEPAREVRADRLQIEMLGLRRSA